MENTRVFACMKGKYYAVKSLLQVCMLGPTEPQRIFFSISCGQKCLKASDAEEIKKKKKEKAEQFPRWTQGWE